MWEMRSFGRARSIRVQAQALAEYALILALIAVVCIVVLKFLGSMTATKISQVGNAMQ
jgi:Flp pilus assembly pilin Flp